MKSKIIYLYGLFLGIFFLLFTIFISDNSHLITKAYKTVENLCEKIRNKEICFVLFSQSNFEKIEFIKKSKAFTNNQVPLIKIYLTEVELKTSECLNLFFKFFPAPEYPDFESIIIFSDSINFLFNNGTRGI